MINTYIEIRKSNWLKYLKIYYSLCKTHSNNNLPIKQFRLDYRSELQNNKANK